MPEASRVRYVSKEEALSHAKELFRESPEVMENLPGNPFPASLKISVESASDAETVAAEFRDRGERTRSRSTDRRVLEEAERGAFGSECEHLLKAPEEPAG